jgi:ABC-2 type transport system permease protein
MRSISCSWPASSSSRGPGGAGAAARHRPARQLIFTLLLAGWSIWLGVAISTRANEIRVAQQLGIPANLPSVAVTMLLAFNAIHPTLALAIAAGVLLLVLNRIG